MKPQPVPPPRRFLFLQGLATPFFARLGIALAEHGHSVTRVNFHAGDRMFWSLPGALDYRGRLSEWPAFLRKLMAERGITDLIVFGDCRPMHAAAIPLARAMGIAVHVFEEAYMRPGWITLEREGTNGNSTLPRDPEWWRAQGRGLPPYESPEELPSFFFRRAADDVRYYLAAEFSRPFYPRWRTHRPWNPLHEYLGWIWRGIKRPVSDALSRREQARALDGTPFYLFPLQLECDYQLRVHSPYDSLREAIAEVIESFKRAAPAGTRLVVKNHPLDNALIRWDRVVRQAAEAAGIADRVIYIAEAKLGPLLDPAISVVTVNSTAGMQALAQNKPVMALGTAIYAMPGLTFQGSLDEFWTEGAPGDQELLDCVHRVLAARCMVHGGFFSEKALNVAVREAVQRLEAGVPASLAAALG